MWANRVVSVRPRLDGPEPAQGVAADTLRAGIAQIQAELEVSPSFPPEVEAAAAAAAANPRLPGLDRTDLPMITIDPPGSMDLDQALHLARDGSGYVLSYAIADLGAFITPGRPGRRRGAHPRADALRRRLEGPAAPQGPVRGRRVAAARPGPAGAALDDPPRLGRVADRRRGGAGAGPVDRQADLPGGAGVHRRRDGLGGAPAAQGGRAPAADPRGGPRRHHLPTLEQEVHVDGRPVQPRVPRHAPGRELERPDVAADRLRRGVPDGLRAGRPAADAARPGPPRRPAAAPHRPGARHRVAGRAALRRPDPRARPDRSPTRPR